MTFRKLPCNVIRYLWKMIETAAEIFAVTKVNESLVSAQDDFLACEEPLEISLAYWNQGKPEKKNISVTMRTPGNDAELAAGFLFTEGIIQSKTQLKAVHEPGGNAVIVELTENTRPDMQRLERNFYTSSSCGVCGKSSMDSVRAILPGEMQQDKMKIPPAIIFSLPALLRKTQDVFERTGGLHASALFDTSGELLMIREDIGRHNALDKLIGNALMNGSLPLDHHILLLSGRASFELVQKAAMAGIRIVIAVGAPSTLAVSLAKESGMTLAGFLREKRFNIYCGEKRIDL